MAKSLERMKEKINEMQKHNKQNEKKKEMIEMYQNKFGIGLSQKDISKRLYG